MTRTSYAGVCIAALFVSGTALASGPEWVEDGDAGSTGDTAQRPVGEGPMGTIRGILGGGANPRGADFEDMYLIQIVDPQAFVASTSLQFGGDAEFDTALWLFQFEAGFGGRGINLFGLLANDNEPGNDFGHSTLLGESNDGSQARLPGPGHYFLAITRAGNAPFSNDGDIFFFQNNDEISGPDGEGGFLPHAGWRGDDFQGALNYKMTLAGVEFPTIPAPGALALLGVAGWFARKRQRA